MTKAPEPSLVNTTDALRNAFEKRVAAETGDTLQLITMIQADLIQFRFVVQKEAEEKTLAAMLTAVGGPPASLTDFSEFRRVFRQSLLGLANLISPLVDVTPEPTHTAIPDQGIDEPSKYDEDAAEAPPPPPSIEVPDAAAPDTSPPEEPIEDANKGVILSMQVLLDRVDSLKNNGWTTEAPGRLPHLIQALAAECRFWQDWRDPSTSTVDTETMAWGTIESLQWEIGNAIRALGGIRKDAGVTEYIKGNKLDAKEDWLRVANHANHQLALFDEAQARAKNKADRSASKEPAKDDDEEEVTSYTWPKLPALREVLGGEPLLMIGGIAFPEKVSTFYARFGITVEWVGMYHGKGCGTLCDRLRSGRAPAVILLEKFMAHKESDALAVAARGKGTFMAYGGNAGTACIQRALETLDALIVKKKAA